MVSGHDEIREKALAAGVGLVLDARDLFAIGKPLTDLLRGRGVLPKEE
jgi:hypothetical protein